MKKTMLTILFCGVLVLGLTGCGNKTSNSGNNANSNETSNTNSQNKKTIKYDLEYDDNRILESTINVDDYIYKKDGKDYVNLEKMITDAGWEVEKIDGVVWMPSALYRSNEYIVRLKLSGQESHEKGSLITAINAVSFEPTSGSDLHSTGLLFSMGLNDISHPNRDVYIVSTSQSVVVDYRTMAIFAYCLDQYRYSLELPVNPKP